MLADLVSVRGRFARSVRLDADADPVAQLEGYLPTARSLEVVRRIAAALCQGAGTRAFSITGPYGSGKSSLALFLDTLLAPMADNAHLAARRILDGYDPATAAALDEARAAVHAAQDGFIRAVITTPQRESITTTVLRALLRGAIRRAELAIAKDIAKALERAVSERYASPSYQEIRTFVESLCARGPVLLVVDEFGKNLEAYAENGRAGDLYLLQELAEWANGGMPLLLISIQHLAFEAYAQDASTAQRREWAKVQGRFEDIAYIDAPAATRALIAAALQHSNDQRYTLLRNEVACVEAARCDHHGQPSVADPGLVAACYPLHPTTLLVLPELCARYGQNERTLFSFLASSEPQSVATFTRETDASEDLPWVRLDRVYDYFVESASTFVGASRDASRWIEIETTIRDASGLSEAQSRVLKAIGVLNLVASGGALRASEDMLALAMAGAGDGLDGADELRDRVAELVALGLITHRDFASEYRLWQGSDFDIPGALASARREASHQPLAALLSSIHPMRPLVASRHSIATGTVRAFAQAYWAAPLDPPNPPAPEGPCDGLLVYVVDRNGDALELDQLADRVPIVLVRPHHVGAISDAAVEVAALRQVIEDPSLPPADHAARRELAERLAYAHQVLERAIAANLGIDSASWTWLNPPSRADRRGPSPLPAKVGTSTLSDVLNAAYPQSPRVSYEVINRTELTSAGARARRNLFEAMVNPRLARLEMLGLEGDGPEAAIYHAVLGDSGIHVPTRPGPSSFGRPDRRYKSVKDNPDAQKWQAVWDACQRQLEGARTHPIDIQHVLRVLMAPPYGLRHGTATVVLVAALLANATDIALYEHGSFKFRIEAPLIERLVRNPGNFSVKYLAIGPNGPRRRFIGYLAAAVEEALGLPTEPPSRRARPTLLSTVKKLISVLRQGGPAGRHDSAWITKTKLFHALWDDQADRDLIAHAVAVRDRLATAQEPDLLLFHELPAAVGGSPIEAHSDLSQTALKTIAVKIADAVGVIATALPALHQEIKRRVLHATWAEDFADLAAQARSLDNLDVLAPDVRAFAERAKFALDDEDVTGWAESIGGVPTDGSPPSTWTDRQARWALKRLDEIGSTFLRVAALAAAYRQRRAACADAEPFTAYAVTITAPDGITNRDPIAVLRDRNRPAVERAVSHALETLTLDAGLQPDEAQRAMLARLAEVIAHHPADARLVPPRRENHAEGQASV